MACKSCGATHGLPDGKEADCSWTLKVAMERGEELQWLDNWLRCKTIERRISQNTFVRIPMSRLMGGNGL
jgi:hypothetical protein